jgi:hypothetical protein
VRSPNAQVGRHLSVRVGLAIVVCNADELVFDTTRILEPQAAFTESFKLDERQTMLLQSLAPE